MGPSNRTTERLAADPTGIARAAALLRTGRLVAFGTETVYGLGADAADGEALARLFASKGRPRFNPLIVHVAHTDLATRLVQFTPMAYRLAAAFWPGPLTLVLPRAPDGPVHDLAAAGLSTLALRIPANPATLALLSAVGRPIAAPSANRSGRLSPTRAADVLAELDGRIDAVLDTGPASIGLESTIIDAAGDAPILLRPGGVPPEAIERAVGRLAPPPEPDRPSAPGQLASHYAPSRALRLHARAPEPTEAWLAFGPSPPHLGPWRNLSPHADLLEAARNLFACLRELDTEAASQGLRRIAVAAIPERGLGIAINDRLRRAAAPRPETFGTKPG